MDGRWWIEAEGKVIDSEWIYNSQYSIYNRRKHMQQQQSGVHNHQQRKQVSAQSQAQTMQVQQQQIHHRHEDVKHPPESMLIRNRRYSKLKELWKQGYFEEQSIMLRYPRLYYEYVGQFKKDSKEGFSSMSQFLEKQIISSEYRRLLEQSQQKSEIEGYSFRKQQSREQESQMQEQSDAVDGKTPYEQKLSQLKPIDLQMQEQALIDELQLQFIEGSLPGFDYDQIDKDKELDNRKVMDEDEEEKYFNEEGQQERDINTNTGVQDF